MSHTNAIREEELEMIQCDQTSFVELLNQDDFEGKRWAKNLYCVKDRDKMTLSGGPQSHKKTLLEYRISRCRATETQACRTDEEID